jgi:predicted enzyme related to lactoylglutathione lyase
MPNKFFWYDVMVTDTGAARKFYCDVVGWDAQDQPSPAPGMQYTVFSTNGHGVAGLMPIPEDARKAGVPPMWMGYVAVDDVNEAVRRLEREGGKVHRPPTDVPGIIRFAVVADPQGAGFIIAKGLIDGVPPELAPGTSGTAGWHELYATNGETAFAFYERMFGWAKGDALDMGPLGKYQLFATGGANVGGIMTKPAAVPVPHWTYYFNVPGIDAAASRVTASGGKIVNGPMQVPGDLWIVRGIDPQGAGFALVAPKR